MRTIFTTGQVAKICKVAPRTVSKWFDSGRLRGYRIPGSQDRRIPREHLIRFLKEHGMPLGEATHTYSILTIGDGLVSQIPAILATIAAGLVVTRTAGEEDDKHLGDAITRQISGQPRVLLITGLLALLMTLVPGFPKIVFAVLGIAMLTMSAWRYRHQFDVLRRAFRVQDQEMVESRKPADADDLLFRARDRRIEQVSRHHGRGAAEHRQNDHGKLAALALVNRNAVR